MGKLKIKKVKIKRGTNLEKLAKEAGFKSFAELHALPENKDLRKTRAKPGDVVPGDVVMVPEGAPKPSKTKYTADNGRMKFTVDGEARKITVLQTWSYEFLKGAGHKDLSDWSSKEKADYQKEVEKQILKRWDKRCKMGLGGSSDFAKYYGEKDFVVDIDVKVVGSGGHWLCKVFKLPPGTDRKSNVDWGKQIVELDTADLNPKKKDKRVPMSDKKRQRFDARNERRKGRGKEEIDEKIKTYKQDVIAHEFGHMLGNVASPREGLTGDEYNKRGELGMDRKAIMNSGNQLRRRYFEYLVRELNKVIPKTEFNVTKLR